MPGGMVTRRWVAMRFDGPSVPGSASPSIEFRILSPELPARRTDGHRDVRHGGFVLGGQLVES